MTDGPLYFGCWGESGHYLFTPDGDTVRRAERLALPVALQPAALDQGYCPRRAGVRQGEAKVTHVAGRTVLAFWDRSVDTRPGSHSTFVLSGTLDFDAAVAVARAAFPEVWARYRFAVVPIAREAPDAR
jgi:hypothetical protein